LFNLKPVPEFLAWLEEVGVFQNQQPVEMNNVIRQKLIHSVRTIEEGMRT
jgi:hypothetical protein